MQIISKKLNNLNQLPAFSLIELMLALVAISVVLAAFVPVVSGRFAGEVVTIFDNSEQITSSECDVNFANSYGLICTLCRHDEACVTCGGNCPLGMSKNKSRCTCE